ncbi:flagellar hook-length control protein FliK [bacterium]|nr:flagellar hook-length control protein FliK [bacterium]
MLTSVEPSFMSTMVTPVAEPKNEFSFSNNSNGFQSYLDASMRAHDNLKGYESFDNTPKAEEFPVEKLTAKIEKIFEAIANPAQETQFKDNDTHQESEITSQFSIVEKVENVYRELKESGLDDEEAGKMTKDLFQVMGVNIDSEKLVESMKKKDGEKINFLITPLEALDSDKIEKAAKNMKLVLPSITKIMMKLFKTLDPNSSDDSTKNVDDMFSTIHKTLLKMFAKTGLEKKDGDRARNIVEGNDVLIKDIVKQALVEIKTELTEKGIGFDEKKVDAFVKDIGSLLMKMAKAEEKKTVKTTGFKVNLKEINIDNDESLLKFINSKTEVENPEKKEIDEEFLKLSAEFKKILSSGVDMIKDMADSGDDLKSEKIQKVIADLSKVMGQKLVKLEKMDNAPKSEVENGLKAKVVEIAKELLGMSKNTKQVKVAQKTEQAEVKIAEVEKTDDILGKLVDDVMEVLDSEKNSAEMKSSETIPAAIVAEVNEVIKQNIEKEPEFFVSEQNIDRIVQEVSEKIVTVSTKAERNDFSARKKVNLEASAIEIDISKIKKEIKKVVKTFAKTREGNKVEKKVLSETNLQEVKKDFQIADQVKEEKVIDLNARRFQTSHGEVNKDKSENFDKLAKKLNVKEIHTEVKAEKNVMTSENGGNLKINTVETKGAEVLNFGVSGEKIISDKNNPGINMKSEEWKFNFQENKTTREELMTEMRDKFISKMDEIKDGAIQFGKDMVKIKLNPENLGELKIELTMTEKGLVAKITSDRPEVRQMLENSASALKQNFSQKGVNLHEFVVSMKENAFYQHQEHEQKNKWGSKKKSEDIEDEEEVVEALDMDALKEIFKSQKLKHGGVDYWI